MSPDREPVTKALQEFLTAYTGRPCGVTKAPIIPPATDPEVPYTILYATPGGFLDGPAFFDPHSEAEFVYQVTSVALREDQAQRLGDRVRHVILGRDANGAFHHAFGPILYTQDYGPDHPSVPATLVVQRRESAGPPGPLDREGSIYSVSESYMVRVSTL